MDKRKSTLIAVTSHVGSFLNSFNIEEQEYSLKAFFSNFFKLLFVVRSSGFSKWVMFFGSITTLMPWLAKVSLTFVVDCALNDASHINSLFWPSGKGFSCFTLPIYGTRTSLIAKWSQFCCSSACHCAKRENRQKNQHLVAILPFFL